MYCFSSDNRFWWIWPLTFDLTSLRSLNITFIQCIALLQTLYSFLGALTPCLPSAFSRTQLRKNKISWEMLEPQVCSVRFAISAKLSICESLHLNLWVFIHPHVCKIMKGWVELNIFWTFSRGKILWYVPNSHNNDKTKALYCYWFKIGRFFRERNHY